MYNTPTIIQNTIISPNDNLRVAKKASKDSNHAKQANQFEVQRLYDCRIIGCFYSLKLKELNLGFRHAFKALSYARQSFIILNHLNSYMRAIKGVLMKTYQLDGTIIIRLIDNLLELGYIRPMTTKVRSNLGGRYVKRVAYMITPLGREVINDLNALLVSKLDKLK